MTKKKLSKADFLKEEDVQLGMMPLGPGSWIPYQSPKVTYALDANRLKNIRGVISRLWGLRNMERVQGGVITGAPPVSVRAAQTEELGGLVKELVRKTQPYGEHLKRVQDLENVRKKINLLIKGF